MLLGVVFVFPIGGGEMSFIEGLVDEGFECA
jgi:hypothetical protein